MVTTYGEWIYEPGTPENKKCWCDKIADYITESGYKIKTTIENIVYMIEAYWETELEDSETEYQDTIEECITFVEESGGIKEFDYYC